MDHIGLKIFNPQVGMLALTCDENETSLVYGAAYHPGDVISVEVPAPGRYCVIQFEDTMPPALVYMKQEKCGFPVPFKEQTMVYSPKSFTGNCHIIRARYAAPEEIAARRNLAFNPYDLSQNFCFYPHAESNIEDPLPGFAARNAIDGIFENAGHLFWPYQGWSSNKDPKAELRLDFGRPVTLDELRLTLRADFPHDSWWTHITATFSDGSSEVLTLEKTSKPQRFLVAPRTVTSLVLHDLIKAKEDSVHTALTQIEAWGVEAENKNK